MTDKTKEFLQKLKDSGNWNDDYDYSKVEYVNTKIKIVVIDGDFNTEHLIGPAHILGRGTKCTIQNAVDKDKRLISEFKKIHGDKYGYSKVKYTGKDNNVIIICKEHGEFNPSANNHLKKAGILIQK